jgi:hypothetical protein
VRRALLAALLAGALFAQRGAAPAPKRKPTPNQAQPTAPDPEDKYACNLDRGSHKCKCPNMVHDVQKPLYDACEGKLGKEYQDCVKNIPTDCQIVQQRAANPGDTCQRSCTHARCKCFEGAPCFGPSLSEPPAPEEDN